MVDEGSGGRKRGGLRNGVAFAFCVERELGSWGVDCGAGVERRKRGAVVDTGRRGAGGEDSIGRDEEVSSVSPFSSFSSFWSSSILSCSSSCSSGLVCDDVDRRRRFGLGSSTL